MVLGHSRPRGDERRDLAKQQDHATWRPHAPIPADGEGQQGRPRNSRSNACISQRSLVAFCLTMRDRWGPICFRLCRGTRRRCRGFGARWREEPHARRCHPCICGVELLDVEEETHPAGGLLADDGGLSFSVSPRERQAGRGAGRPDRYPPLGSLVETAERPAGSVSGLPRHAGHRGINPITGTAAEPRSSVVAASSDDHSVLL